MIKRGKNMRELLNFGLIFREYTGTALVADEGGTLIVHRFDNPMAIMIMGYLIIIIVGYLLGSLNAGIIISKLIYKDDIRNHKNTSGGVDIGDIRRIYGNGAAIAAFIFDGAKTVIAVLIGMMVLGNHPDLVMRYAGPYIGGFAAAAGHAFPFYHKFKGGKSVVAAFFIVLMTSPLTAAICVVIFIVVVICSKYLSLGLIMSLMIYPLILNRLTGTGLHNVFAILLMLMVVLLHREEIKRIGAGTEKKLNFGRKKKNPKKLKCGDEGE